MPRQYGPRTDLVISDDIGEMLHFLMLIERTRKNDQTINEITIVEDLIQARYERTQAAFNEAMAKLDKEK